MIVSDDEIFTGNTLQEESVSSNRFSHLCYENDGTLDQYLKQLASLEPYGHEKESLLWQQLLSFQEEFRQKISFFAIAPKYLFGLLASCYDPEEMDEIFPQSVTKLKKSHQLLQWVTSLKDSLQKNLFLLYSAFEKNDPFLLKNTREEIIHIFRDTPILLEHAFHIYDRLGTFALYCKNMQVKNVKEPEKILREELLCSVEEFEERFDSLVAIYQKMDSLRHKIAEGNLRLVVSIAKPFHGRGVPFMDLIQEGNVGLMKAIDRFDFPLGHHFSTYATWWIRQSVAQALGRQSRVIRLPSHMLNTLSRINRTEQHLLQETGKEPTVPEVAKILDMSVERVNSLKKMANQTISLQSTIYHDDEGKESTLEDRKELSINHTPLHDLARKVLSERLSESIASLPERHGAILRMRYGLDGEKQRSLNEISDYFRISKERIRQIESNALAKLRSPENIKLFEDYFT